MPLHKTPGDPPRKWIIPKPISQQDFQKLLQKRSKTLLRIQAKSTDVAAAAADLGVEESGTNTVTATSDKAKLIKEKKERLETLYKKKHGLVQLLKQIQIAEEQITKNQSSSQGNSGRPPLPPQVKTTGTDSGGMTRTNTSEMDSGGMKSTNTPKMASGESSCSQTAVNDSNPNLQSHPVPRMDSTTPSSGSQKRTRDYRAAMPVAVNPSQFTTATSRRGQGPRNIASSPSHAASDETMAFREARHPIPWRDASHPTPSRFTPTTTGRGHGPSWMSSPGRSYIASPSHAAADGTTDFRDARHPNPWRNSRRSTPSRFTPTTMGRGQEPSWISSPATSNIASSPYHAASGGALASKDAGHPSPWRDDSRPTPSRFTPTTTETGQGRCWISSPGSGYIASSSSRAASDGTPSFRDPRLHSPWSDARPPSPWS